MKSNKFAKFVRVATFVLILAMFAIAAAAPEFVGTVGH
jgi:hypothetical protein